MLAVAAAATLVLAATAPAGLAQGPGQPEPAALPAVSVLDVHVPASRGKLLANGVQVTASCTPDCLLVGILLVSKSVAAKMGVGKPVLGSSVAATTADTPVTLTIRVRKAARGAVSAYKGGGQFKVEVTALP